MRGGSEESVRREDARTQGASRPDIMLTDMTPAAAGQLYPQLQSISKSPAHGHVVSVQRPACNIRAICEKEPRRDREIADARGGGQLYLRAFPLIGILIPPTGGLGGPVVACAESAGSLGGGSADAVSALRLILHRESAIERYGAWVFLARKLVHTNCP